MYISVSADHRETCKEVDFRDGLISVELLPLHHHLQLTRLLGDVSQYSGLLLPRAIIFSELLDVQCMFLNITFELFTCLWRMLIFCELKSSALAFSALCRDHLEALRRRRFPSSLIFRRLFSLPLHDVDDERDKSDSLSLDVSPSV